MLKPATVKKLTKLIKNYNKGNTVPNIVVKTCERYHDVLERYSIINYFMAKMPVYFFIFACIFY